MEDYYGNQLIARPLRSEPVGRDEVFIEPRGILRTMPLGTWQLIEREETYPDKSFTVPYAVADRELWRELFLEH